MESIQTSGKGFKVSALAHTLGDVGRLKLTATTSQIHSNSFFRPNLTKQGDAGLEGVGVLLNLAVTTSLSLGERFKQPTTPLRQQVDTLTHLVLTQPGWRLEYEDDELGNMSVSVGRLV